MLTFIDKDEEVVGGGLNLQKLLQRQVWSVGFASAISSSAAAASALSTVRQLHSYHDRRLEDVAAKLLTHPLILSRNCVDRESVDMMFASQTLVEEGA